MAEDTNQEINETAEQTSEQPSVVENIVEAVSSAVSTVVESVTNVVETATNIVTSGTTGDKATNGAAAVKTSRRAQRVGTVSSDKMTKTVVVTVDRQVMHPKYRRYVRRTSKFMAHDEMGAAVGDKVRIEETRPLSARKRWRVIEIVQKAAR